MIMKKYLIAKYRNAMKGGSVAEIILLQEEKYFLVLYHKIDSNLFSLKALPFMAVQSAYKKQIVLSLLAKVKLKCKPDSILYT